MLSDFPLARLSILFKIIICMNLLFIYYQGMTGTFIMCLSILLKLQLHVPFPIK